MKKIIIFSVFLGILLVGLNISILPIETARSIPMRLPQKGNEVQTPLDLQYTQENVSNWRLKIDGLVEQPMELTYAELRTLPSKTVFAELYCEGITFITSGNYTGVELKYLLDLVEVKPEAQEMFFKGSDDYAYSIPVYWARNVPNLLIAYEKDGKPLSIIEGFPATVVAPGMEGFYWVKWVVHIRLETKENPANNSVAVNEMPSSQLLMITIMLGITVGLVNRKIR